MKIAINEPVWNGHNGNEKVGIAKNKITEDIEVEILYKDLRGNRMFPYLYRMEKDRALAYPSRPKRGKIPELKMIPISAFEVIKI